MEPQGFDGFLSSLKSLYAAEALSDATIVCNDQEFKVHRIILSAHSEYFAKMLTGDWKESSEKMIKIEDFDTNIVEAMLSFMYSFDYDNSHGPLMTYDARVYQIADKYNMPALKAHSKNKFEAIVTKSWSAAEFPSVISVVYETTPQQDRGLRDVVVKTSHSNIKQLLEGENFKSILREAPDFAADLIPLLCDKSSALGKSAAVARYICFNCGATFSIDIAGVIRRLVTCPECGKGCAQQ